MFRSTLHPAWLSPSRSRIGMTLASLLLIVLPIGTLAQDGDPPNTESPAHESRALERINQYRASAGVPPMAVHPALTEAAAGHVRYYDANRGAEGLAGMGLHEQVPGASGFTGVSMDDRAEAAGYRAGTVTENVGFGRLDGAVEWYMATVNHRLPLIHPSALDVGMAQSTDAGFGVIDVGLRDDVLDVELPSVYPPNGATDVPTEWDGAETPDPAPGVPRPLGYPITVAFARYQQVAWVATELRDAAGTSLDVSSPRRDWMRAAAIIPHRPLAPEQTYTARIEAIVDGATVAKTWSFTTRR
jgi:uncharacterized protein YkwD